MYYLLVKDIMKVHGLLNKVTDAIEDNLRAYLRSRQLGVKFYLMYRFEMIDFTLRFIHLGTISRETEIEIDRFLSYSLCRPHHEGQYIDASVEFEMIDPNDRCHDPDLFKD